VQAWDRYAYVNNSPTNFNDPSGHCIICDLVISVVQTGISIWNRQTEATHQAEMLVVNWFFETGQETKTFGPSDPLTAEIQNDPGMAAFREEWENSGYQVPFSWNHTADERNEGSRSSRILHGTEVFAREHVFQLGLSVLGFGSDDPSGAIDAVGGTIGSLDRISVNPGENGQVIFEVYNEMGWASGLRIPGENRSILQNTSRSEPGPGGTTYQYFHWYEEMP
jgi:hypothetical protein